MTYARKNQVSLKETPYYHVVARCVRRAWLWGFDEYAGRDYSHRKEWVIERLAHLTIALVKLRKAVRRRHLWNALSYLAQARNDLIGIERTRVGPSGIKYSRPEHSAENWLDHSLQYELISTHAAYDAVDILRGASALCELARRIGYSCSEPRQFWSVLNGVADGLVADQLSTVQEE